MRKAIIFSSLFYLLFMNVLTRAQWSDPWITNPPSESGAAAFVTVTAEPDNQSAGMTVQESCPPENIVAMLRYNSTYTPTFGSQFCNSKFRITRAVNGDTAIVLANPLDYEISAEQAFACAVSLKSELIPKTLVVEVNDVNDNSPYFDPSTPSILNYPENELGFVYRFEAIDKDELGIGDLTFQLKVLQGSADKFKLEKVGPSSANLTVVQELDREEESFYLLELTVTDKGGLAATKQLSLNVGDKPDSAPFWVKTQAFIKISEELAVDTKVFKVEARDGDSFADPIIYSLEDPRSSFSIDPITGDVKVAKVFDSDIPDFDPYFDLIITATVDRPESKSSQTSTTVFIEDINDNVPRFNSTQYEISAAEDFVGRLIDYGIQVDDPDMSEKGTYQVRILGSDNITSYVKIAPSDGRGRNSTIFNLVIDRLGLLDYENENGIRDVSFQLEVVEAGDSSRKDTCTVTIRSIDVNDNGPKISVSEGSIIDIKEESTETYNGLVVAHFQATDKDSGNYGTVRFRLARNNLEGNDEFEINAITGELSVKNSNLLDYDGSKKSYTFFVEAFDNNEPNDPLSVINSKDVRITINLKDVNDNAPKLPPSDVIASKSESAVKNDLVATIQAEDKDEPGTDNSRLHYTLHSQRRLVGQEACPYENLFRIEDENNAGAVRVDAYNLTNCYGVYEITVQANDVGDGIYGARYSENVTYQIQVTDINNNAPDFIFPVKSGSVVDVFETTAINKPLTTTDGTTIKLQATDLDDGDNGKVHFRCDDEAFNAAFEITELFDSNSAIFTLRSELNRTKASSYFCKITAYDDGKPQPLQSSADLRINIRFEKKQPPYFAEKNQTIAFLENQPETKIFLAAIDPDNSTLFPGESPYDLCYYIACGNAKDFQVGGMDKKRNELFTNGSLDREDPPEMLYVIIEASNNCARDPSPLEFIPCTGVDVTRTTYLHVSTNILDENDCSPIFTESLYGGTTYGDKRGKEVLRIGTDDPDMNDSATCEIKGNITASEPNLPTSGQFSIDTSNKVLLGFDVQENMKGYFTFEVTCTDKNFNANTAKAQVFILDNTHKVNVVFEDPSTEVEAKRSTIERIFTETYNYECNVETVTQNPPDDNDVIFTTVVTHFIDTQKDEPEPVLATDIEVLKVNATLTSKLRSEFAIVELNLYSIGLVKEDVNKAAEIFLILFIIALIAIVAMVVYGFFLISRTLELKRKVKALSATKFGSVESINNRTGISVPNTNVFADGSNPIFQANVKGNFTPRGSDSSGDSVLVGVEDNPEFSDYKPKSNLSKNPGTWDLTRGDENQLPRPSFQAMSRNPLAGLIINEEEEASSSSTSTRDNEEDTRTPVLYIDEDDMAPPPPRYPPPPLPDGMKEISRSAPPPPTIDYNNYAYESDTEL